MTAEAMGPAARAHADQHHKPDDPVDELISYAVRYRPGALLLGAHLASRRAETGRVRLQRRAGLCTLGAWLAFAAVNGPAVPPNAWVINGAELTR
jgi:hypothetical protein